ncbi:putative GPI anchored cell wall protein [Aspergillus heteromorphus CBS 117.55]|uniref:Putative GPI anchored cell wall protein n=1 Tax=Aspergillus heteromorphus CBS 117.55 TaxID=1448321 RepID=A0A317WIE0_9EURO|nr:putative GPI anchored cell wall protein [Aspergillus heteromorphus CBS 117.55]PWY86244.1 putative GPI anchored cell wall protein [Aspergillus heteromorphus CBS 117.55]
MLFAKSTLLATLVVLCNAVVASQTNACLLSAVGSQPNPADLQAICVTNVDKVKTKIADLCGDETQMAMVQFEDTCASAGYKDVNHTFTASSGIASSTSGPKTTKTGPVIVNPTASRSSVIPSSSSSQSHSAYPSQTVSSGSSDRQLSAAAFAAVVFVGFAATL